MRTKEIQAALYYTDKLQSVLDFCNQEDAGQLIDRKDTAAGTVFFIQEALNDFMENTYGVSLAAVTENTKLADILNRLRKIYALTFELKEVSLTMPVEELKNGLEQAQVLASALPILIYAVEAGEDEQKADIAERIRSNILKDSDLAKRVLQYYTIMAEQGNADAQYALGVMLCNGDNVSQDYAEGLNWIRQAALQEHPDAINLYNEETEPDPDAKYDAYV